MANKNIKVPGTMVYQGKSCGQLSFSAYFLRDLYSQGRIDERLVRQILSENGFGEDEIDSAIDIISSTEGGSIKPEQQITLDAIANMIVCHN